MTLTQLAYIAAVAKHRHFGAAAEACHVTQPTLSMQIQKLEEDLGVIIFDRSVQPIRLTDIGEAIVEQAKLVISEAEKISELTSVEKDEIRGRVSLGVIPTLAPYLLPLFITRFIKKYSDVDLVIEELQTQVIAERMQNDTLDLGLLVTPLHDRNLIEHPIFYEPFYVYTNESSPLAELKKVNEKNLSAADAWLLGEGHCFRDQALSLCAERPKQKTAKQFKRRPDEVKPKQLLHFESGNFQTLKRMVDQAGGYTLLPWLASQDLVGGRQRHLLKEFASPVPTREVSLIHSKNFKRKALVQAVKDEILSALPSELLSIAKDSFERVDLPIKL